MIESNSMALGFLVSRFSARLIWRRRNRLMVVVVPYAAGATAIFVLVLLGSMFIAKLQKRRADSGHDGNPWWLTGEYTEEVLDHDGRFVVVSAWRIATCAYARSVAVAVRDDVASGVIQVDVKGFSECAVFLEAEGVAAQWDSFEGWSVTTRQGKRWYPDGLVPTPIAIARWFHEVSRDPRLGLERPPSWRPEGVDEFAQLAEEVTVESLFAAAHDAAVGGAPTPDDPGHGPPQPRQSPE